MTMFLVISKLLCVELSHGPTGQSKYQAKTFMKSPDNRCCGSGVCIINDAGECWCGQVWDGEKMVHPPLKMMDSPNKVDDAKLKTSDTKKNSN